MQYLHVDVSSDQSAVVLQAILFSFDNYQIRTSARDITESRIFGSADIVEIGSPTEAGARFWCSIPG
jgi:hypothetical protein